MTEGRTSSVLERRMRKTAEQGPTLTISVSTHSSFLLHSTIELQIQFQFHIGKKRLEQKGTNSSTSHMNEIHGLSSAQLSSAQPSTPAGQAHQIQITGKAAAEAVICSRFVVMFVSIRCCLSRC